MQAASAEYLRLLSGSVQPVLRADAWYAGRLVARDLEIAPGGSVKFSMDGAAVLDMTFVNRDGSLSPGPDGVLSPFGGEIAIRAGMRRGPILETFPLGRFVVVDSDALEQWMSYLGKGGTRTAVIRGGTVSISANDRMYLVNEQSFVNRVQPTQPTVLGECRRILQGIAPWKAPAGISDKALAAQAVTYSEDRGQALADLAALLDCSPFADQDGSISLRPKAPPLTSLWTVPRGAAGQLASPVRRKVSRSGMHNAVIAQGTAFTGAPLRGIAVETDGPLRWGGPLGKVPAFVDAPLASSQADIDAAARTALAAERRTRWVTVTATIVTNYALQIGDVITIPCPRGDLPGIITDLPFPAEPAATMEISMSVDPFKLARVA